MNTKLHIWILITALFFTAQICLAQMKYVPVPQNIWGVIENQRHWQSRDETTVIFAGDSLCKHLYVAKPKAGGNSTLCLVLHDERGCPNEWKHEEYICTKCLQKIVINEVRYFPESEIKRVQEQARQRQENEREYARLDSLIRAKQND